MKRDFTEESRQRLLGLVNQVESEKNTNFTDWIGDRWYDFQEWLGILHIVHYLDDLNSYHKKIIDKNNATEKKINSIFDAVKAVDLEYSSTIENDKTQADTIVRQVRELSFTIKPSSNKFNVDQMKTLTKYSTDFASICANYKHLNNKGLKPESDSHIEFSFGWNDVVKSFGNVGKAVGVINSAVNVKSMGDSASLGLSAYNLYSKVKTDWQHYSKIGRAIGTKNATSSFIKKQLGLTKIGHASTATKPSHRFYNNLHNTTSPYNLKKAFDPLTGAKGFKTTVAAWGGVALTAINNYRSNLDEQKESNGSMSTGRVVAETVTETVVDTAVAYAGTAIVGAAITAVTGVVAAPVVVALATGVALAGINAVSKAIFKKSATEVVSDAILDGAEAVGNAVKAGAKVVANWFKKPKFA